MALLSLHNVSIAFGEPPLLDQTTLQLEKGERICILGRNGSGKTTLLKLISGGLLPDSGEVRRQATLKTAFLPQAIPENIQGTVFDVVANGLGRSQHAPDSSGGWELQPRIEAVISRTGLDGQNLFEDLSAGLKRRVLFARALVQDPDLLLLDEPTNHLDLDSVIWLEDFLLRQATTLVFVTHDRVFLQKLASRIIEIDRGRLSSWACDYATYLNRRQAALEAEEKQQRVFDKKLSQEEVWIRQGIKARRTRNEGRVRALQRLRQERRARREHSGNVRLELQSTERSGRIVIEAEKINFSYAGKPVVHDFSTTIMRGDKVGIIGPNGIGKTTLLRVLLGELPAQSGTIKHGTRMQVVYFDQLRAQLDEEKSVRDNVAQGNDTIDFNGRRRHVIGYLQDFLFSPQRARTPVRVLSGGEKNRLLLAKLFTRPANLLILDEPTNDLDLETLELLEELLLDYEGTMILISHDRAFLNHVVTSTLVFEGQGRIAEYVGGYDDWLAQRKQPRDEAPPSGKRPDNRTQRPRAARKRKLGYNEQRELEALPQRIEALETEQQALYEVLADPQLYQQERQSIVQVKQKLDSIEEELVEAYARWETLEALSSPDNLQ